MTRTRLLQGCICVFLLTVNSLVPASEPSSKSTFPFSEKLVYHVEWRLVTAGTAIIDLARSGSDHWQTNLTVESAGLVTRLYKVLDNYKLTSDAKFCASNATMDAQEGKRHILTQLSFEQAKHKVRYEEKDLIKNTSEQKELDTSSCTHEILGALAALRATNLEPGKWAAFPVTNGKKMANARIEAQSKENLSINGKTYQTIRYEAFLFDNVLYKRKGRLLIWISDDADRIPVQLKLQLGFPVGGVTILLDKQQKT